MKPYAIRLQGGQMIRSLHLRKSIKSLNPHNSMILDAGCDTGRDAIYFGAKYPNAKIVGIDISDTAIAEANERLASARLENVTFCKSDIFQVDWINKFDIVYSIEVLEHVKDYKKCIAIFNRVLKPSGKLVIHVPCLRQRRHLARFNHISFPDHVRKGFEPQELAKALKENGFNIIRTRYTFGLFGSLAWEIFEILRKRKLAKRFLFLSVLTLAFLDTLIVNKGNGLLMVATKVN